jgi:hypothetical protein
MLNEQRVQIARHGASWDNIGENLQASPEVSIKE